MSHRNKRACSRWSAGRCRDSQTFRWSFSVCDLKQAAESLSHDGFSQLPSRQSAQRRGWSAPLSLLSKCHKCWPAKHRFWPAWLYAFSTSNQISHKIYFRCICCRYLISSQSWDLDAAAVFSFSFCESAAADSLFLPVWNRGMIVDHVLAKLTIFLGTCRKLWPYYQHILRHTKKLTGRIVRHQRRFSRCETCSLI